jgi:hypothetical protein
MHHLLQVLRLGPVLALCLTVSGCFVSDAPLIGPDQASFPFERIVFEVDDRPGEPQVLARDGDAYRLTSPDSPDRTALLRLVAAGDGAWVAQMWPPPEAGEKDIPFLYALLVVGDGGAEVSAFAAMKPDDFVPQDGLVPCDNGVCIGSLEAYVAYARAQVAAGTPPETVYRILERD